MTPAKKVWHMKRLIKLLEKKEQIIVKELQTIGKMKDTITQEMRRLS